MEKISVLEGDIKEVDVVWRVADGKLVTTGLIQSKELPISELLSINKKQEINHLYHVDFRFNRGINFTACMQESAYIVLSQQFEMQGNQPTGIGIPIVSEPLTLAETINENLFFILLASLIFYSVVEKEDSGLLASRLNKEQATQQCHAQVSARTTYGAEFPFSYSSTIKFFEDNDGYRVIEKFKLKNAFNMYTNAYATCYFNIAGALTNVEVNGNKLRY